MPKVTEAYLEARHRQIHEAAIICFARNGFHQTTMADIAREAGITPGAIYRYFPSKEDIIAAGATHFGEARERRFQYAEQKGHAADILTTALRLSSERWAVPETGPELRVRVQWLGESLRNPRISALFDGYRTYRSRYAAIVKRGQEHGEVKPNVDPEAIGQVFLALQLGLECLKATDPTVDVLRFLDAAEDLLLGRTWEDRGQEDDHGDQQEGLHTQAE